MYSRRMLTLPLSSPKDQDGDRRNIRRIADRQAVGKPSFPDADRKIIESNESLYNPALI